MLEECSSKESSGRETYWINEFKTYGNGYNATTGGDGSIIWNYDEIRELYAARHSMKETAKIVGCHPDTVSKVVKDIKRSHSNSESHCGSCKPPVKIEQYNEDILVQVLEAISLMQLSTRLRQHTDIDGSMHNSSHLRNHIIHK